MARIPTIKKYGGSLKNKPIILRVDFNVPIERGKIKDDFRIKKSLPTIDYLRTKGSKIILVSHLGRPKGHDPKLSLKPTAEYLSKILKQKVLFFEQYPPKLKNLIPLLPDGGIIMLENFRFWLGEEKNDIRLARDLAGLGEIFVNDAFAVSHRKNASLCAITKYLPSFAGLLLESEISNLDRILKISRQPFVIIFGGAKLSEKLPLIKKFIPEADFILTAGGVANNLLAAKGFEIGKSLYEKDLDSISRQLLKNKKIKAPLDIAVAKNIYSKNVRIVSSDKVSDAEIILDLGPETLTEYAKAIGRANMILWNGPAGYIENPRFARGSYYIARAIAKSRKAFSVVGGGDTVEVIRKLKLENKISFLSTGGGAMLEYLSGKKLPAIEALEI